MSNPVRGHRAPKLGPERAPKLGPEHVGPVAKYLAEHSGARVKEILQFIEDEFGVQLDRLTLRRYIKRYGLGCLQGEIHQQGPLF